ncbi:MAG: aminotransferase class I/II-fold pyridoxal phosphate-dependent enzyme [Anaerolineae bacterium]|jgi:aminotransferase|nr:aminotransferase class I/II-fold pyridoxal phosphate-dependent enzyme [Anaerolineae bacterium]
MNTRNFVSQRALEIEPSAIRRFFDIVATMKDVISLGIGEPDFVTPEPIVQAGIEALKRGETHYTSNSGLMELRRAIAEHMDELYKQTYNPASEILVTVGVSEALYLAMAALLDEGDEIIIPEPCFVSYKPTAQMVGAVPVSVPTYAEDGFQVSPDAIRAAITDRTKVILIASPNNPTGAVMSRERLDAIAVIAKEHNLVVISDEIYDRLVYGVEHTCFASLPGMYCRTVVLQGFSKAYAMTGWRIGYIVGPAELVAEMRKVHQYLIMSAPSPSQWAALKALEVGESYVQEMHAEYNRRRQLIVGGLNNLGLLCSDPKGAFYAFPCIKSTGMADEEFAELLLQEEQVAVIPGSAFGPSGVGYVRMSYATAYEKIEAALERMARFAQRHG